MRGESPLLIPVASDEGQIALQAEMSPTEAPKGWQTAEEMALANHVSLDTVRATLREINAQGKLLVRFVMRPSIDGRMTRRPVYARKPDEKAA